MCLARGPRAPGQARMVFTHNFRHRLIQPRHRDQTVGLVQIQAHTYTDGSSYQAYHHPSFTESTAARDHPTTRAVPAHSLNNLYKTVQIQVLATDPDS